MRAFIDNKWLGLPLALALLPATALAARQSIDRVVAVIDNEVITWRELQKEAQPFLAQLEGTTDPKVRAAKEHDIYKKVLDIQIGDRIVTRELEKNRERLGVTEQDVDRAIEEVQRMNNLTREQLEGALYAQGLSWAEYRKKLRDQIERARLIQFQVQGKVQVKDADAKRRCEERKSQSNQNLQVCASHILVAVPAGASDAEVEKLHMRAAQLRAELQNGADFAAYALKYSDDKAAPDGKLGCFGRGEMVEAFEKVAFSLKPGELSPVVRTDFGFHIIKVTDRQSKVENCDDPKTLATLKNELYQEELERQTNDWIAELRKKAFVEVRL